MACVKESFNLSDDDILVAPRSASCAPWALMPENALAARLGLWRCILGDRLPGDLTDILERYRSPLPQIYPHGFLPLRCSKVHVDHAQ